jgi:carboxyl-terminal processing protease
MWAGEEMHMAASPDLKPNASSRRLVRARLVLVLLLVPVAAALVLPAWPAASQEFSKFDRDQGRMMLKVVKDDLSQYYYDAAFHGLSLDEVFARADDAITRAHSHSEVFSAIAGTLRALDDSHTFFIPPGWDAKIEYGWDIQMIGDRCHVRGVRPGSDAEAQGVKRGDLVLSVDGQQPTRQRLADMLYDQRLLAPRGSSLLVIKPPAGSEREVIVHAKVVPQKRVMSRSADLSDIIRSVEDQAYLDRDRFYESGDDVMIWKMPGFDMSREDVGRVVGRLRKHKGLILDLRGNPGGAVETLESMVGGFLGDKVAIAEVKSRLKVDPIVSHKTPDRFVGTLVVLIDSDSASAAEIFAREIQLAGRGKVLGDRSSGSVMLSRHYSGKVGMSGSLLFESSITVADVIMSDGKSLEKTGVTPDEILLPTAEDLANDRDPVMARAAALCGVTLDPVKAGTLFPIEWKR